MSQYDYWLLDVFTDRAFGGNQLAVFPDARGLSDQQMQALAKELNLAETTFVFPAEDAANDFKVRIFTSELEMPMAGHPTIGTAFVLASQGLLNLTQAETTIRFEEKVGVIPLKIRTENGRAVFCQMQQPLPHFGPSLSEFESVAKMLSLPIEAFDKNLSLEVVSCGVPYLIVPISSLEMIEKIRVRPELLEQLQPSIGGANLYVFSRECVTQQAQLHSRMFWLEQGVFNEDAATGSASGPLGCYLARHKVFGEVVKLALINEQGFEMNRPSFIHIEIEQQQSQITAVRVGGEAYPMGKGSFML